jgi:hypothetical protein
MMLPKERDMDKWSLAEFSEVKAMWRLGGTVVAVEEESESSKMAGDPTILGTIYAGKNRIANSQRPK